MNAKIKSIFVVLLTLCLAFQTSIVLINAENPTEQASAPTQIGVSDDTDSNLIAEYETAAQNRKYTLFYDKKNAWFALRENENGYIWYSVPNDFLSDEVTKLQNKMNVRSQLIVDYIYDPDEASTSASKFVNSHVGCLLNGRIETEKVDGGFRAVYYFDEFGFEIPVEYKIDDDCFVVTVAVPEIKETKAYRITAVNVLPMFGAGNSTDSGYVFVPDGCGALVEFNNGKKSSLKYDKMLYGKEVTDTPETQMSRYESVYLPVISTVKNGNNALTGIITEGDSNASIALINGNSDCAYTAVSSKVNLRNITEKILFAQTNSRKEIYSTDDISDFKSDYQVKYYTHSGDKANYAGTAEIYRDYLVKEKGLTKKTSDVGAHLNLYGAVTVNSAFFGIPYTKTVPLTTFAQAQEIAKDFGDYLSSVRVLGWSGDILNKAVPSKLKISGKIGGNKGYSQFSEYLSKNDIELYLDVDFTTFRKNSGKYSIKTVFNEIPKQKEYLRSVYSSKLDCDPYYLLSPNKLKQLSDKFLSSAKKNKISGICLSGITNTLYSDYNKDSRVYRNQAQDKISAVIKNYSGSVSLAGKTANAHAAPYMSIIYQTPVYSSGYELFDKEIPFYQIVFHGYIPMTSPEIYQTQEPDVTMLNSVEGGIEPLYAAIYKDADVLTDTRYDSLYSSTYSLWSSDAKEAMKDYLPLLKRIANATIAAHSEIAENVDSTVYDNNIEVVVNYSDSDYLYKDTVIKAKSYAVIERG